MIDYDKTIDNFFGSVIALLQKRCETAKDKYDQQAIIENINIVRKIASNPAVYCDYDTQLKHDLVPQTDGFIPVGTYNNQLWLAFDSVVHIIAEFYDKKAHGLTYMTEDLKKSLLVAIKRWNYVKSTNLFKDFIYPFKSPMSFAVHVNTKQK